MSALADDVHREAAHLKETRATSASASTEAGGATGPVADAERALLRALGALMKHEESSFDPVSRTARILEGTEGDPGVRLTDAGEWRVGAAPEADLLAAWTNPAASRPSLRAILDAIPKSFSSAKVGALVIEICATLDA